MNYVRKEKTPIDKSKVKDLLRSQHIFRHKINEEIPTYSKFLEGSKEWENGILAYMMYGADEGMREMIDDLGISWNTNRYESNLERDIKRMDGGLHESDKHLHNFINSRFIPIDMTEYIYDFPSANEIGHIPFDNLDELEKTYMWWPHLDESHPANNIDPPDELPPVSMSAEMSEDLEDHFAEDDDDDDDDDDPIDIEADLE